MAPARTVTVRDPFRLVVDVTDILDRPGATKHARLTWEAHDLGVGLAKVAEGSDLRLDLRLDALVDGIHVSGSITGPVVLECRRCLADVRREVSVEAAEVFLTEDGPDDQTYSVAGDAVDLAPMVRDTVVLALPLHPLCREECRGLCPVCGADRNEADCGHSTERVDVRWEPLARLREEPEG